ncbi:MAG: relaxase/mobilization nuclease domain-containing protein [Ruthenibacterium sp.]
MAYTSIITVGRLDNSIGYVQNKEKTTRSKQQAQTLEDAVAYALNRDKTERDVFETAINCRIDHAFEDMCATKKRFSKMDGVPGYHLVQSFAKGEATPEIAHQIGLELARRLLGDKYEAVVATHLNTDCFHSHIVFNSVSCEDGRKYHSNAKNYYLQVRNISDELCRKYGLSVITPQQDERNAKSYVEWKAQNAGMSTWRSAICADVDEAIKTVLTWKQFVHALEQKGYTLRFDRKYPVLKPPGKERFVRFKTLGEKYTPEAITLRILYPQKPKTPKQKLVFTPRKYTRLRTHGKPFRKTKSLRALYFYYLYRLGALPRKPSYTPYAVRQDIYRLDKRIEQMRFLSAHRIYSREQLAEYRESLLPQIKGVTNLRQKLYKKKAPAEQIAPLTAQLGALRHEEKLCRDIASQSVEMEQRLKVSIAETRTHAQQQKQKPVPQKQTEFRR